MSDLEKLAAFAVTLHELPRPELTTEEGRATLALAEESIAAAIVLLRDGEIPAPEMF